MRWPAGRRRTTAKPRRPPTGPQRGSRRTAGTFAWRRACRRRSQRGSLSLSQGQCDPNPHAACSTAIAARTAHRAMASAVIMTGTAECTASRAAWRQCPPPPPHHPHRRGCRPTPPRRCAVSMARGAPARAARRSARAGCACWLKLIRAAWVYSPTMRTARRSLFPVVVRPPPWLGGPRQCDRGRGGRVACESEASLSSTWHERPSSLRPRQRHLQLSLSLCTARRGRASLARAVSVLGLTPPQAMSPSGAGCTAPSHSQR